MTPKERVIRTVEHKEADRIPLNLYASNESRKKLFNYFHLNNWEDILVNFKIDIRVISGGWTDITPTKIEKDGTYLDIWGVRRGNHMVAIEHPLYNLETSDQVDQYNFPSSLNVDYDYYINDCKKYPSYAVAAIAWGTFLAVSQGLIGMEGLLIRMIESPELISYLFKKITNYYLEVQKKIYQKAGNLIDIVFFGEDFATQNGLMFSKEMWRLFIKPNLEKMFKQAKEYGYKVMFHSCGAISEIIPDLIEIGVDILEPIQPKAKGMDIIELNKKYGDKISFHGNIDTQITMPRGTKKDVEKEVLDIITNVAPGGGLIICTSHEIQGDVPVDNIITLYDTAIKYGKY